MADGAIFDHATCLFVFAGLPLLQGRAAGTYFTLTPKRQRAMAVNGVDAAGYYVTNDDRSYTMSLVCLPNSDDNTILGNAFALWEASPAKYVFPVSIKYGLSNYTGNVLITGTPPIEMSDAATTVTWTFESTRMVGVRLGAAPAPLAPV